MDFFEQARSVVRELPGRRVPRIETLLVDPETRGAVGHQLHRRRPIGEGGKDVAIGLGVPGEFNGAAAPVAITRGRGRILAEPERNSDKKRTPS